MKRRSVSLGGRPGPPCYTDRSPFARLPLVAGRSIAPPPIENARPDGRLECRMQQDSQGKHPFLSRSSTPFSPHSQRSLSQTCLTQSQDSQRFSQSQDSQPEDFGCEQWIKSFQDKDTSSLSQPKPASPSLSGLTSNFKRRNVPGPVGGGSTPGSSTCTSAPLCYVGPQNGTTRPWPQCNVSEELEQRLGGLEKLREEETALLRKISDDYQQIKILLDETNFDIKGNRSKLSLQQSAFDKLLKEEETANSSILAAIKAAKEAVMQNIGNLKQVAEGDAANKENVTTSFKLMAESFRGQLADLKREIIAELQMTKQREPPVEVQHQLLKQPSHIRLDVTETTGIHSLALPLSSPEVVDLDEIPEFDSRLALMLQPPVEVQHQLLKQPSHIRLDVTETTGIHSLALPFLSPEVVDLDEIPEVDTRLAIMLQPPVEEKHQLLKQPSHIQLDVTETTGIQSLALPLSSPEMVNVSEIPDLDTRLTSMLQDDSYPAYNTRSKTQVGKRLDEQCDNDIRRSFRRKMLRARVQKKIRCSQCIPAETTELSRKPAEVSTGWNTSKVIHNVLALKLGENSVNKSAVIDTSQK